MGDRKAAVPITTILFTQNEFPSLMKYFRSHDTFRAEVRGPQVWQPKPDVDPSDPTACDRRIQARRLRGRRWPWSLVQAFLGQRGIKDCQSVPTAVQESVVYMRVSRDRTRCNYRR